MSNRGKVFSKPSLTDQSFRIRTDVNCIMARVRKGAPLPTGKELMVGDFSNAPDLHEILQKTNKVKESFMRLPPEVRNRFRNDPQRFIDYMSDEKNHDEQIKLGLREKPEEIPEEKPVEVIIKNTEEKAGE